MAVVTGTPGNDVDANKVQGGNDADELFGLAGDDEVIGYGGNDRLDGGPGEDHIDGGEGLDTVVYSTANVRVGIDLNEQFVVVDAFGPNEEGDHLRSIENGVGGKKNDSLVGDEQANSFHAGKGADFVMGQGGADLLWGEAGKDRFYYDDLSDSAGSGADTIKDFKGGQDRIDLGEIDASSDQGGDQAFAFIGKAAFSEVGQVRFIQTGGQTMVQVNADADHEAEMTIALAGKVELKASDFVL
jgi:serralysin